MKRITAGILAHVDAGKTTLAEAMLFATGAIRKQGRVDSGSAALDTHELERSRGITIFSSVARISAGELAVTLLDTPGHVDFSAETERTLSVLDCAVLVISGTDGIQPHTRTLWSLLAEYSVPVFIFVSKMDIARRSREELLKEICAGLSDGCFDAAGDRDGICETLAACSEETFEKYIEEGTLQDADIRALVCGRKAFPCVFGSGLRLEGVDGLLSAMERYAPEPEYPEQFGARVYKISYDDKGTRLTHLKVTGGTLRVKGLLGEEKVDQIRIYNGERFTTAEYAEAGSVCSVTGPELTRAGDGFGFEKGADRHVLEPVMRYRIVLPEGCDPKTMMPKLRRFEEEDPLLRIEWNSFLGEINAALMGEVQTEVLCSLIKSRTGVEVGTDSGRVMYKETIAAPSRGAGHFEPLRHYAEVHLLLEPAGRGEGLVYGSVCAEDALDRNGQRLIMTNLAEKQHLGVLTGSPVTDIRITLTAGRAHLKHTEGGDFRQAVYRAVRQGLMKAQSVLLEPFYSFSLTVPTNTVGRAINDIRMMGGSCEPEPLSDGNTVLTGEAPVCGMNGYASAVRAYTGGKGVLICAPAGYRECHNAQEVIEAIGYDAQRDTENTADSVFCSHGAGHTVRWDEADAHMHIK